MFRDVPLELVRGGSVGGGLTKRGFKKPTYGDAVKSSLIQDISCLLPIASQSIYQRLI
jgi:hypothetical protein